VFKAYKLTKEHIYMNPCHTQIIFGSYQYLHCWMMNVCVWKLLNYLT